VVGTADGQILASSLASSVSGWSSVTSGSDPVYPG
jgi:hypothetical protein